MTKLVEENYNDTAREIQENNFVETLCNKSLSATVWHDDHIVCEQMHGCIIDHKKINDQQFQIILTVDYSIDQ